MKNLPFFKRMDTIESPTININNLTTEPISKQEELPKPTTVQPSKIDIDKIFTLKNVGKFLKLSKESSVKETTKGIGKSLLDKYSNILGEKLTHTELPGIENLGKRLIINSNKIDELVETQEQATETQEELVKQSKLPPKPPPGSPVKSTDKVGSVVVEEFKPEKTDIGKEQLQNLQLSSEYLLDSSEKLRVTSENLKEVGTVETKPKPKVATLSSENLKEVETTERETTKPKVVTLSSDNVKEIVLAVTPKKVGDVDVAATEREKELESRVNFDSLSDNIQATQERETDRLIDSFEDLSGTVEETGGGQSAILASLAAFFTGGAGLTKMLATSVGGILKGGIGGILGSAGLLAASGAAGYGVGTLINKYFIDPAMQKVYKEQDEKVKKSSSTAIEEQTSSFAKSKDVSLSFEKRAEEKRKVQLGAMGGFDKDFGATFKVNNAEIASHVKKFDSDNMDLYSQYSVNEVKALRSAFKFPDIGGGENNKDYAKKYVDMFKERLIKKGTKLTDVQLKEQAVKIEKRDKKRVEEKKVEVEKIPSLVAPTVTTESVAKANEIRQEQIKKAEKSKHKKVKVEGDITKLESKSIDEAIKYKPVIVVEKPVGIGVASSVRGIPSIKPQVLDKSDEVIKQIAKKEKSEKIVTERTIETKGKLETTQAPQPQIVAVPIPAQEKPITRRVTSVDDAGVELLRTLLAG